jgi:hypothetical protein
MASAKPRKKKIIIIIIIILSRIQAALENDESTTFLDTVYSQLVDAGQCANGADADTDNWTEEENDVFACVEEVESALIPNATSPTLSSASSSLGAAIIAWKESL